MNKIIRNSIISIVAGVIISVLACYIGETGELINYIGAMFVLGGCIFLDQWMVEKAFTRKNKVALVRLPVYLLMAILLILGPIYLNFGVVVMRVCRSFGIAFMLLALWRFFTFTTVEEEKIHKD